MANGKLVWHDLTVENAAAARDFYANLFGWTYQGLDMGGYEDYQMMTADGEGMTGICWRKGCNDKIPPTWLVYFQTDNIAAALEQATQSGAEILDGPRDMGGGRFAALRDPFGAVFALFEMPKASEQP